MFIDRHMSEDVDQRREYSEVEQIQAHRLAAIILREELQQAPPAQLMAEDVEEDNS